MCDNVLKTIIVQAVKQSGGYGLVLQILNEKNMSERVAMENEKRGNNIEEYGLLITLAAIWGIDFDGEDDIKDDKRIAVFL